MGQVHDNDEMRPEYDFTDGVRGKYVQRAGKLRFEITDGPWNDETPVWVSPCD